MSCYILIKIPGFDFGACSHFLDARHIKSLCIGDLSYFAALVYSIGVMAQLTDLLMFFLFC